MQPTKTLVLWRIFRNVIVTYGNLRRGFVLVSFCSLYNHVYGTIHQVINLFSECSFALKWWNWLFSTIDCFFGPLFSFYNLLSILDWNWSSQVKNLIISDIANIVWLIWGCRKKLKFDKQLFSNVYSKIYFLQSSICQY